MKDYKKKYTINNVNLDEVWKFIYDYITINNNKFDFHLVNCECLIEFDNNFTANIETNYLHNIDDIITKIKSSLLYWIDCFKSRGYKIYNINQLTIKTISDRCNMTYEHYMNQPMHMCERNINMNFAKNPELINSLDQNRNHPLIRKYSHIPFNN